MRVVTTCHKAGFDRYAHRVLETWGMWEGAELVWYTEGFDLPTKLPNVIERKVEDIPGLSEFKARHKHYIAPNYLFDVVRFSHKVFAACDALKDYDGLGVWLDGDCVTRQPITEPFLRKHIDGYMALLKRKGMYTETGFWLMDCSHPEHQAFLKTWLDWYHTDAFKSLSNWTDCETLDATVRLFERDKRITTTSLSGPYEKEMHPMAKTELGQYIDHTKGARKDLGFSPESKA